MRRDLIIGPLGFEFPGRTQPVFTDHLVCVVARDNPRLADGGADARATCRRCRTRSPSSAPPASAGARSRWRWSGAGVVDRTGAGAGHQPADAALRGQRHRDVRVRPGPAGPPLPRHPRPGRSPTPRSSRCRSPRPPTGTRGATPSRPSSGCAGCSTTSPSSSRTTHRLRHLIASSPRTAGAASTAHGERRATRRASAITSARRRRADVLAAEADERRRPRRRGANWAEAEDRAARARDRPDLGHRQGGGVAHDRAVGGDRDEDRDGQQPRRCVGDARARGTPAVAGELDRDGRAHHPAAATTGRRGGWPPSRADQPGGVDAERERRSRPRREPDDVLVDERRGRDVGHHHAEATARTPPPARGTPRVRERRSATPSSADASRRSRVRSAGCVSGTTSRTPTSIAAHSAATVQSIPRQPTGIGEQAADQRRQHRRDATDGDHQRERPGRRPAGHHVGDDRPPDDHAAGAGEALHEPGDDQHGQGRGERADHAGGHADRGAGDQRARVGRSGPTAVPSPAGRTPGPTRNEVSVSWTPLASAPRSAPIAGKPGR